MFDELFDVSDFVFRHALGIHFRNAHFFAHFFADLLVVAGEHNGLNTEFGAKRGNRFFCRGFYGVGHADYALNFAVDDDEQSFFTYGIESLGPVSEGVFFACQLLVADFYGVAVHFAAYAQTDDCAVIFDFVKFDIVVFGIFHDCAGNRVFGQFFDACGVSHQSVGIVVVGDDVGNGHFTCGDGARFVECDDTGVREAFNRFAGFYDYALF